MNRKKAPSIEKLNTLLEESLQPVKPRDEFVSGLRDRLMRLGAVRALEQRRRRWIASAALTGLGVLGVFAMAAAAAAGALRIVGRILRLGQSGSTMGQHKGTKTL